MDAIILLQQGFKFGAVFLEPVTVVLLAFNPEYLLPEQAGSSLFLHIVVLYVAG